MQTTSYHCHSHCILPSLLSSPIPCQEWLAGLSSHPNLSLCCIHLKHDVCINYTKCSLLNIKIKGLIDIVYITTIIIIFELCNLILLEKFIGCPNIQNWAKEVSKDTSISFLYGLISEIIRLLCLTIPFLTTVNHLFRVAAFVFIFSYICFIAHIHPNSTSPIYLTVLGTWDQRVYCAEGF